MVGRLHLYGMPTQVYSRRNNFPAIYLPGQHTNQSTCKTISIPNKDLKSIFDLISDPQTSGGLLVSLPEEQAWRLVKKLHAQSLPGAIVGEARARQEWDVVID